MQTAGSGSLLAALQFEIIIRPPFRVCLNENRCPIEAAAGLPRRAVKLINRNRLILTYGTFGLAGIRPIFSIQDLSPKHSERNQSRRTKIHTFKLRKLYSRIKKEKESRNQMIFYPVERKYMYMHNLILRLI